MAVNFAQHALTRMSERGISREEVIETLTSPINTLPAQGDRKGSRGWISRTPKKMLLRVIMKTNGL